MRFLLVLTILPFLLPPTLVLAAEEIPRGESYSLSRDPLLLIWTFGTQRLPKVQKNGELNENKEKLAQWRIKQNSLWSSLKVGKKFTINASAYTAASDECGKSDGVTSSGLMVEEGRTLACPSSYPFGTLIKIEGVGVLRCEDRGGAIKGNHFDIYMEKKQDAFAFGRQHLGAEILSADDTTLE